MRKHKLIAMILAAVFVMSTTACQNKEEPNEPEPSPEEQQEQQDPAIQPPKMEDQANSVQADKMIQDLSVNLREAKSAGIHVDGQSSQIKIEITPQLLEEISGFLCQNYTLLKTPIDLSETREDEITLYATGEESTSFVEIYWRRNQNDEKEMIALIQEDGVVASYRYDYTTYRALSEVINQMQYENEVILTGKYIPVRSANPLDKLFEQDYTVSHVLQFDKNVLYCISAPSKEKPSYFEVIDTEAERSLISFAFDEEVVDVQKVQFDDFDYCIITNDAIHYRSSRNKNIKQDYPIPGAIKKELLEGTINQTRFDLDYINNVLVYISKEGVALSDRSGKRKDTLLSHSRLYELLDLIDDGDEESAPRYVSPKLMNDGKTIICPIWVPASSQGWAGVTIFNLSNGTYQDYIGTFEPQIQRFTYPDKQTMIVESANGFCKMDLPTREISRQKCEHAANEAIFSYDTKQILTYETNMNYEGQLYLQEKKDSHTQRILLNVKGDYFKIYGVTENYVLCGYSDIYGSRLVLISYS